MSEENQDQNKSEEPTPFKLRKAREKGQVARGMDLGFVGSLVALTIVALFFGEAFFVRLATLMHYSLTAGISGKGDPVEALGAVSSGYWTAFKPLLVLGGAIVIVLVTLELIQLRGFIFTTQPLKPDFNRLNPAKGLKRLFSMRMLKETLKNILKFAVYCTAAWVIAKSAIETWGVRLVDASWLALALEQGASRLLFVFIGLAFVFMVIDQIIVRREFHKQMRMSRREVTREAKDREGEPRLKQKRKEIHKQMREQTEGLGKMPGADVLIVNPEHYAVALRYDAEAMNAPKVLVKGRDHFAQLLKRKARLHGIPIMADPPLARRLHADCRAGQPIWQDHFQDVARLYRRLREDTPISATHDEGDL